MAAEKDWGRMRISRPIGFAVGGALIATAIFVGVATGPPAAPRPLAPVVFYELVDAHRSSLLEQPLDGATQARVVASVPSTGDGQVRWEVAPAGTVGLAVTLSAPGAVVEAFDLTGGRSLWRRHLDRFAWPGVWSSDGRLWASNTETPDGAEGQFIAVVDVAAGTVAATRVEPAWWPQGFTTDGDLVLTERVEGELGDVEAWRFRLRKRATGAIIPVDISLAGTTPRTIGTSDVATEAGRAVRRTRSITPETGEVTRLEAIDLQTGKGTLVGPAEDTNYNWIALTPDGSRILTLVHTEEIDGEPQNALMVIDARGEGAEVWRGHHAGEQVISRDGRYLGMTGWVGRSLLTVVHLGSGHSVEIPLPPRTIAGAIRAIVDPADVPLIAVAPLQPRASAAPTPAAAALAGAPDFIATSSEVTPEGSWVGRVSILAPGQGGGIAVVDAMPPLELPIADGYLQALPRPGTDEILIAVSGERLARYWLWTPGAAPVELGLPAHMPKNTSGPHWRPDGGAIAFSYWKQMGEDIESGFAILDVPSGGVRVIPVEGPYSNLAGWSADGRNLLLGYQICVEGCPGRYAFVARLDPETGFVTPFEVGDRNPAAYIAYYDSRQHAIGLTSINADGADDVLLRWPAALGDPIGSPQWSSDLRDLYVTGVTDDVATMYLLRDVLGRGPGMFDSDPIALGRMPEGVQPGSPSPDRQLVLASDRAGTSFLVKLATGESWEVGPFANGYLSWLP